MKLPSSLTNRTMAPVLLRLGLAIVFLYAGVASLLHPEAWVIFLPGILTAHIPADIVLKLFSAYQFVLVVWLVSGWKVRYVAALCALTLTGIVVTNINALDITFRDIALVFMALALVFG